MSFREEREMLERFGCKDIVIDLLVNNYFITFVYDNKEYKIEHILNVYGVDADYWELLSFNKGSFNTLEELLNHIK